MNKNIIQSIEKNLYSKVVNKMEEMRKEISASLFEYRFPEEQEGEEEREKMEMEGDDEEEKQKELDASNEKECLKLLKKKYPNKSSDDYKKMIEDGKCKDLEEAYIEEKKLIGKQHKLDANRNGRLDSEDFRLLRAKKVHESILGIPFSPEALKLARNIVGTGLIKGAQVEPTTKPTTKPNSPPKPKKKVKK